MPKTLPHNLSQQLLDFVEEVGLCYENVGLPRMAGRIMGFLVICEPEAQTINDLAKGLKASKASISTMTRLLINTGMAERVAFSGERRDFFRAKTNSWDEVFHKQMAELAMFRKLMERGLELLKKLTKANTTRLEEMRDFYLWFETKIPALLEDWKNKRKNQGKNNVKHH